MRYFLIANQAHQSPKRGSQITDLITLLFYNNSLITWHKSLKDYPRHPAFSLLSTNRNVRFCSKWNVRFLLSRESRATGRHKRCSLDRWRAADLRCLSLFVFFLNEHCFGYCLDPLLPVVSLLSPIDRLRFLCRLSSPFSCTLLFSWCCVVKWMGASSEKLKVGKGLEKKVQSQIRTSTATELKATWVWVLIMTQSIEQMCV